MNPYPADIPVAVATMVLGGAAYLIHCQREHVRRKTARRLLARRARA